MQLLPRLMGFTLFTAGLSVAFVPACGGIASDYCSAYCECVRCSDDGDDRCHAHADAAVEEADIYGCSVEIEELTNCVVEDHDCDDTNFDPKIGDDCQDEYEDYVECLDDGSDVIGTPGTNSGPEPPGGAPASGPTLLPGLELPEGDESG